MLCLGLLINGLLTNKSAETLASVMVADSGEHEINDTIVAEVMKEIGNVVINGVIGTLGNLPGVNIAYRTPVFKKVSGLKFY